MKIEVYFKKGKGHRADAHVLMFNKSRPEGFSTDSADFDKFKSELSELFGSPKVGSYRCRVLEDGHPGVLMQIRPVTMSSFSIDGIKSDVAKLTEGQESDCYRIGTK